MDAKEAIALTLGAHSFGRFHSPISQFRYHWTRRQNGIFNNQVVKHVALKPQYFTECKKINGTWKFLYYGDEYGKEANTSWLVAGGRFTENGGPYQWFHVYDRCPASNECAAINGGNNDPEFRTEPDTPPHCCQDLEPGMQCQPDCVKSIRNDETALSSDVGLFMKFKVSEETGRPFGCEGMDYQYGITKKVTCPLEDYAPEGVPLHNITSLLADDQVEFMKVYVDAHEKMINNGYNLEDLDDTHSDLWFNDWDY